MRTMLRRLGGACLLASACLAEAAPGGIAVSPLRLDVDADHRSSALTVDNGDTQTHRFQVEVLRWQQDASGDRYTPTDAVLANPPLFELAAGARQILRIGLLSPGDGAVEQAYRVYVTEIPQGNATDGSRLNFALRLGVPLYVAPQAGARREWHWSAQRVGDAYVLQARNTGNVHQRRAQLQIGDADRDTPIGRDDGFRDVLAGATAQWRFAAQAPYARRLRIRATTDAGADDSTIAIDTP